MIIFMYKKYNYFLILLGCLSLTSCSDSTLLANVNLIVLIAGITVPVGLFSRYILENKIKANETQITELNKKAFFLDNTSYDTRLKITEHGLKVLPNKDIGTLTIILEFIAADEPEKDARLSLIGEWKGRTGIIKNSPEDLVIFVESDRSFVTFSKKPYVEYIDSSLTQIYPNKKYKILLTAFPGFATPLVPDFLKIRVKNGQEYTVTGFHDDGKGWYSADFSFH